MTLIRKYFRVFIAALLLPLSSFARIGFADWGETTPGGNDINNFGEGISINLRNGESVNGLSEWFFYKNNIVGKRDSGDYFMVNENSCVVKLFKTEPEWRVSVTKENLNPHVTRWYNTDWKFFNAALLLALIIGFYISIPIVGLYFWMLYKAIRRERFKFNKPYTIILTLISGLLLMRLLLDIFPESL